MVQKLPTGVCPLLFRDKVHESVQALTLDKPSIRGWCVSMLTFALFTKFLLQLSKKAGTLPHPGYRCHPLTCLSPELHDTQVVDLTFHQVYG